MFLFVFHNFILVNINVINVYNLFELTRSFFQRTVGQMTLHLQEIPHILAILVGQIKAEQILNK